MTSSTSSSLVRGSLVALCVLGAVSVGAQEAERAPVLPGDRIIVSGLLAGGSVTAVIDDRLDLQLPLVGILSVRGLSARHAMDSVRVRAERFGRPEMIAVSFERRIPVIGDVNRPALLYLDLTVRVRDAIALAGGVAPTGHGSALILRRDGKADTLTNWRTSVAGDRELRSGDQIVVPRETWYKRNVLPLVSAIGIVASVILTLAVR